MIAGLTLRLSFLARLEARSSISLASLPNTLLSRFSFATWVTVLAFSLAFLESVTRSSSLISALVSTLSLTTVSCSVSSFSKIALVCSFTLACFWAWDKSFTKVSLIGLSVTFTAT